MLPLAELQRAFSRAVFNGGCHEDIVTVGHVSTDNALQVHRNTVKGALLGALRLSFPSVVTLVGENFFNQAARIYVEAQPPACIGLAAYGDSFPDFLQDYRPALELAYLADVARFDFAIDRAMLGPSEGARRRFSLDQSVMIDLPAALAVLQLNHPADLIRDGLVAEDDEMLASIDLRPAPRWILVWRVERKAVLRPVCASAALFLHNLFAGVGAHAALAAAATHVSPEAAIEAIQHDVFTASFCHVITQEKQS